jgi:hypothetical protein
VSVVHNDLFLMSFSCCLCVFLTFIMPFVPVSISSSKQQIMFLAFPPSIEITCFFNYPKSKWTHVGHVIFDPLNLDLCFFIQIYKNSNNRLKLNWSFINSQSIREQWRIQKYSKIYKSLNWSFSCCLCVFLTFIIPLVYWNSCHIQEIQNI